MKYNNNTKQHIVSNMLRLSSNYQKWRNEVIKIQGNRCQVCGTNKYLQVHHKTEVSEILYKYFKYKNRKYIDFQETLKDLDNIPELWETSNGEVLCKYCHAAEHPDNLDMLI